MYCAKCGAKNEEGMNFCEKCGASLNVQAVKSPQQDERKKRQIRIAAICAAVVLVCIIGIVVFLNSQKQAEYNEKMESADRYYQDMDYEKAETAYLDAIDIKPKEEEPYIQLSRVYIEQGRFDEAVDILERGQENAGGSAIEKELQKLKGESAQYKAYYELVMEYQEKYGVGGFSGWGFDAEYGELAGLSVVRLIDFNDDGNQEMLLAYKDGGSAGTAGEIKYEVWAWQDGKLVNVLPATSVNHGTDVSGWIATILHDGTLYIHTSWITDADRWQYLAYDGKEFTEKYAGVGDIWRAEGVEEAWYVDGEKVSKIAYEEALGEVSWERGFDMSTPYSDESGEMTIEFLSITGTYGNKVIAETDSVIEFLKSKLGGKKDKKDDAKLEDIPTMYFSSGAGGWRTEISINEDGTFTGVFSDSDMGRTGDGYPNGTMTISEFSGKFTDIKRIDDYTYTMQLESIETKNAPGEEWIEDGILYVASDPYGMDNGKEFQLYLPGKKVSALTDEYILSVMGDSGLTESDSTLPFHGLYNVSGNSGFFSSNYY